MTPCSSGVSSYKLWSRDSTRAGNVCAHHQSFTRTWYELKSFFLKENEYPPVREEKVKTFRWDHRLQIQNLFMAVRRVPRG